MDPLGSVKHPHEHCLPTLHHKPRVPSPQSPSMDPHRQQQPLQVPCVQQLIACVPSPNVFFWGAIQWLSTYISSLVGSSF